MRELVIKIVISEIAKKVKKAISFLTLRGEKDEN
jgi:hypothetical protein